jgi:hypothetical protein
MAVPPLQLYRHNIACNEKITVTVLPFSLDKSEAR